jgi:hypothetical protein
LQSHFPGGQEQLSPHEQADLALSALLGQFAQVQAPAGQEHVEPQLKVESACSPGMSRTLGRGDLLAGGFTLVGLVGTVGASAFSRWAGACGTAARDEVSSNSGMQDVRDG